MSNRFEDFLNEQLQDPEFREEYEALQPEHAIIQAIIDARKQSGLPRKSLQKSRELPREISANQMPAEGKILLAGFTLYFI